ncbi:hypothetical protein C731_3631 [Mycolicibacterium hassiacum DSM 44199]|uniref:Uncharacterized protein n=1 Tax=Mycolicibacterium hassiacum (strain DSM 44199 / CIP 105218 / JCM 12690 / 3849) TaxID=1122247 RepID=K5BEK5_MYCHD|nr:hypothetical protein C731_3631 [Mycolicibacterium hassiacum DSM 44199]
MERRVDIGDGEVDVVSLRDAVGGAQESPAQPFQHRAPASLGPAT